MAGNPANGSAWNRHLVCMRFLVASFGLFFDVFCDVRNPNPQICRFLMRDAVKVYSTINFKDEHIS